MTDDDLVAQILSLSPKLQAAVAQAGGDSLKAGLLSTAISVTNTPDADSALAALKADPTKLAALEDQVATQVAAAQPGAPPAVPPSGAQSGPGQQPSAPPPSGGQVGQPTAPQQAAGSSSGNQLPWHPPKELMYVAPRVSFLVIAGFFAMLGVLLWQEMHPSSVGATDADARVAAAISAADAAAAADAARQAADKTLTEVQGDSSKDQNAKDAAKKAAAAADTAAADADKKAGDAKAAAAQPPMPSGLQNVLFTLLGALGAAFTQVVNYWLGSSKGSADKSTFLANSIPLQAQNLTVTPPGPSAGAAQVPSQGTTLAGPIGAPGQAPSPATATQ